MHVLRSLSFIPCFVLMAAPALCQQASSAPSAVGLQRGYMSAVAGGSFGSEGAATFAVEYGETRNRNVQTYATFTYFDNLLNETARGDLNRLGPLLTGLTGATWELQGRDRGLAFSGGAKYLARASASVRPYIGGGPGVLNLKRTIRERGLGDVTDVILPVFGAADGVIDVTKVSTFKPMAEVIAGVGIVGGRTYVDVGYRFRKVFRSQESFTFSQFCVGVGMKF